MGNHDVGRGMAAAARTFWIANQGREVSQEMAMKALDAAAEDYIGADAEFDDELMTDTDLSNLVATAFGASDEARAYLRGECDDDDPGGDDWYDNVYTAFRHRYKFC